MDKTNPIDPASGDHRRRLAASSENEHWITFKNRKTATKLQEVPFDLIPSLVRREAAVQARWIVGDLRPDGVIGAGTDPLRWISVLSTLVLQPKEVLTPDGAVKLELGTWDSALRYIRTGLWSIRRPTFEGWRAKLARDPRFALRASFLQSMRQGWGIPGEHRWHTWNPAWECHSEEYLAGWNAWVAGRAPEPDPVQVVNVQAGITE